MEPLSLTAGAIATLVLTKALEKTGEKLGEKVLEQGGKLMQLLEHKSPETASAIELVAQRPELAEQQPLDYGEAVLVEKVETAAKTDPEIAAAIRDLANTVQSQPQYMQQINKIAETVEKIGNVNQNSTIQNQPQPPTDTKPTYTEKTARIKAWGQFIKTLARFIWLIVLLIVIIPLIGKIFIANAFSPKTVTSNREKTTVVLPAPPDWNKVDAAIAQALKNARTSSENYASQELAAWVDDLMSRVDNSFLDWYFDYFNQKQIEYKSLFVQISSGVAHLLNSNNPSPERKVAEVITADFQKEFANRVLRPQIAQLKLERLTQQTVNYYLKELSGNINNIPINYQIPQADWDRYLSEIAITINDTEGKISNLSLKVLAAGGGYLAVKPLVAPLVLKVGSKVVVKLATKGGAKIATKTGAALVGKVASAVLDSTVGVGIILWDIWDNNRAANIEKPILRSNLAEYLQEVRISLLNNPENGIMTAIDKIQSKIIESI